MRSTTRRMAGSTGAPSAAPPPGDAPSAGATSAGSWLATHLRARAWALGAMAAVVLLSMAYTLLWAPVVQHHAHWLVPGDIWQTFDTARYVGWGAIGDIYSPTYGLVTFPGIVVLLAPVPVVTEHLHLTESLAQFGTPRPTAWLVLGPVVLLIGSVCLPALDAVAERVGIPRGHRIVLVFSEAALVFLVVTMWGHPEDMLALGLALYALLAGTRGRWSLAGWLWGATLAFQPLAFLLFPLALAGVPPGRRLRVCIYAVVPTAVLLTPCLVSQWSMTTHALLHQANAARLDHPTPWIALSPRYSSQTVGAGPGRIFAVLLAGALGVLAWRRRPSFLGILWLGALALSGRCFFESVMNPFYLGPPLAVILLVAAARPGPWRLPATFAAALVASAVSFHRLSEWAYWTPMVALLAVGLALAWPGRDAFGAVTASCAVDARAVADRPVPVAGGV